MGLPTRIVDHRECLGISGRFRRRADPTTNSPAFSSSRRRVSMTSPRSAYPPCFDLAEFLSAQSSELRRPDRMNGDKKGAYPPWAMPELLNRRQALSKQNPHSKPPPNPPPHPTQQHRKTPPHPPSNQHKTPISSAPRYRPEKPTKSRENTYAADHHQHQYPNSMPNHRQIIKTPVALSHIPSPHQTPSTQRCAGQCQHNLSQRRPHCPAPPVWVTQSTPRGQAPKTYANPPLAPSRQRAPT